MKLKRACFSLVLTTALLSCAEPGAALDFSDLGSLVDELIEKHAVPGAGFALFNDGGVLYEHVAGVKDQSTQEPVDSGTVFEAASISKPIFACIVFQLAREGAVGLDAPLDSIVEQLPELADDPRSRQLTPRLLLSHRGGLPNWRSRLNLSANSYSELFPPDDRLAFVADPDTGYRYSGEGYVLLQRLVEERLGIELNSMAADRIFTPLGMVRSSFLFDDAMRTNYAKGHNTDGEPDKWELSVPLASSTLHTTAADLARFGVFVASEILTDGPCAPAGSPASSRDAEGGMRLGWGPGLGIIDDGPRRYVYHGGNNVIFIADFIYGVDENLGYVLLTNSSNGQRIIDAIERRVFGRDLPR